MFSKWLWLCNLSLNKTFTFSNLKYLNKGYVCTIEQLLVITPVFLQLSNLVIRYTIPINHKSNEFGIKK